jgi:hypothetical protein
MEFIGGVSTATVYWTGAPVGNAELEGSHQFGVRKLDSLDQRPIQQFLSGLHASGLLRK